MSVLRIILFPKYNFKQIINLRNTCLQLPVNREDFFKITKEVISNCKKSTPHNGSKKRKSLCDYLKFGFAGLGITTVYILKSDTNVVVCKASKIVQEIPSTDSDYSFKWTEFLKYLYPHLWYLLLALSSALMVAVLNIWIPQGIGELINVITYICQSKSDESMKNILMQLTHPAIKLAHMYATQALLTFVYIYTLSHLGEKIAVQLREDLFKSIIMQDISFFDKNHSGEIVSRLTSDIQDFKSAFKTCISQGIRSLTQIIGCVFSIVLISPQLTGAMVLCLPTIIIIGTLIGRKLRKLSMKAQSQAAKATAVCEEAIQNIRTVRAFAAEDRELQRFIQEMEQASSLYEKLGFGIGLFQAGTNLFLNGNLLCTLYFGGHLMSKGKLSPGDLMAFLMATQTIQRSLSQLSLLLGTYVRCVSAGSRIFQYLDLPPSPMMIGGEIITDESLAGDVIFRNVKFSYPTRPDHVILNNFDLHIPRGKVVAIVGSSGNGKSTVAALLERFYDVDEGSILIDGKDIKSVNPNFLRGNVLGYINQEPVLFATSIMENIRYGKPDATDEEVIAAAKEANAHDFIAKFHQGYQTQVGEKGAQLSGGQKQRVAIARALLKHPSILVLDEATSALDYESERIVQKALEDATRGRTVLVIAHRLSTIQNADIIVVLQRGAIVEMGNHKDLIKNKGAYYSLVSQQEKENN